MLRLTQTKPDSAHVVLKAEGQVVAEWVELLEEECRKLMNNDERVLLDLAEVSYADRRGVQLLRELGKGPLSIINCAPLVQDLLNEETR